MATDHDTGDDRRREIHLSVATVRSAKFAPDVIEVRLKAKRSSRHWLTSTDALELAHQLIEQAIRVKRAAASWPGPGSRA